MTILNIFLLVFGGLMAFLLIAALFMRKEYHVRREIIINTSSKRVFDYLKLLKNQDNFNKWVMVDPGMKRDFVGTDGTVGFIYRWNGNKKAGEGELELKSLIESSKIETEIRFVRPFPAVAFSDYVFEIVSDNQTKVIWGNRSKMIFPMNIMVSMVEKMLAKDMDISLSNLKTILER
ncbi:MAG TPA: SRPBCC family protein [Flavobacterium sp.]|uniref:SRPBCC family protein n=1 Tax=Flavobacterium sp. TaxID=239 RepID=UPI002B9EE76A|nr:SRPBCC family protein [Flavobacterium sp.]HSD14589.1 SRPBCC family protein [Flavobacterium sp.]